MSRVLLVNMPFSSLRWPALGISLLQAALQRLSIPCDIASFQFDFAESIGLDTYQWLNDSFGFVLGGERLFARHVFADLPTSDDDYHREVLLPADPGFTPSDRSEFEGIAAAIEPFLDACWRGTDWSRYPVVGFTTTFQQTMASLALARRIKQSHPGTVICLGGANCEGAMGEELLRRFPQVDLVFSGEADHTFPAVVTRLRAGQPLTVMPGVFARDERGPESGTSVESLDDLPYPNFDDYFERLGRSALRDRIDPLILFETARGCWWGAKKQCTFCGLNGGSIAFRSKTANRALDELRHLRTRYGVRRACATDNIMDFRYYETLMPMLRAANLDLEFEFELKTNMTRAQVETLVAGGLRAAQLGVETLSTPILRLMRKGVTAVQNIQTLKWMTAAGIEVKWNFLYGFPGEDPAAYADLPALFAKLVHLAPPQASGLIRIDRFSPYFESPETFGLPRPRPCPAYRHVFPFPAESIDRLAYYFTCREEGEDGPPAYVLPALEALESWSALAPTVTLRARDVPGGTLVLHDTRPGAATFEHRLRGLERALYLFCDTARSLRQILDHARGIEPARDDNDVVRLLQVWLDAALMIQRDGSYLSLALTPIEPSGNSARAVAVGAAIGEDELP